ncbi:hypothetical protein [Pseudoroseomonas cervicalis]|uniref:hypothetical protein n=1 Tax=Teichococcus cervicalis TaxID=204525 RepID=UPI0022F166A7|nr:hypothetical protein [Pseudoroseomonas cervicalis]WBV41601.1 hypothetical protein PFY06_10125 [Pseudoroseomonas cervicalis]
MTSLTVHVPLAIRRRGGRKRVVAPEGAPGVTVLSTRADPALVKALAWGFRYRKLLDQGRYASITEMAAAEKIDRGYLGRLLQLTLLAPEIVEAILDGRQPEGITLVGLLEPFSVFWGKQLHSLVAYDTSR